MRHNTNESMKIWRETHPEQWKEMLRRRSRERRAKLRTEIIQLLGSKCMQCGFSDPRALQIDHINRNINGKYDRHCYERKSKGQEMYMKEVLASIKAGSKDYQLLCANCNWIKRFENNEIRPRIDVIQQP